jgi:uncharacterized protein with gpF-like domain
MRNAFKRMTKKIPFDMMNEYNYTSMLKMTVLNGDIDKAYYDIYNTIGITHGKRIGKGINKELKEFNDITFESEYRRNLFRWVMENAGIRITSVKDSYIEYIRELIASGFSEGKDIRQITKEILKLVNRRDFYRYQAMRIARTETTTAANQGAVTAGRVTGVVMDKIWISALDARTRRLPDDRFDHAEMHLKKVPLDEPFKVPSKFGIELLQYPGAQKTQSGAESSAGNVINCRCTVAQTPRRDSNGRLVRV